MNPYINSSARHQAIQAAQIALILRQLGKLRSYTKPDLDNSLSILNQRHGKAPKLTPELLREIHKRTGQMIALELSAVPLDGFSSDDPKAAA